MVTNNPLDVAIEGSGFFVVQQPDGTNAYTRAGAFQKDAQGQLVTPEGYLLDPPIIVPQDATSLTIGSDGTVSALIDAQTAPGRDSGNSPSPASSTPAGLTALGKNLFQETSASGEPQVGEAGQRRQGGRCCKARSSAPTSTSSKR
jgi:flagellar basal-body rod protein FlgG